MTTVEFGGKQDDLRVELHHILQIEYKEAKVAFVITDAQYATYTDSFLKLKYPTAIHCWLIYGQDPNNYAVKKQLF